MPRPSLAQIVVVLLLAMLGLMAVSAAYRARSQRSSTTAAAPAQVQPAVVVPDAPPLKTTAPAPAPRAAPKPQPRFSIVRLQPGRTLALHSKPGGRVIAHVSSSTQFGSQTTLTVAAKRGPWVGLTSTDIPNGTLGWVKR